MQLSECPKCKNTTPTPQDQCPRCGVIYGKTPSPRIQGFAPPPRMEAGAATSVDALPEPISDAEKSRYIKIAVIVVLVAGALWFAKSYRDKNHRIARAKAVGALTEPAFVVYGVDDKMFNMTVASLQYRSKQVEIQKFDTPADLAKDAGLMALFKKKGVMKEGVPDLPAVQMDGVFVTDEAERDALIYDSYAKYFEPESQQPYVVIYGIDKDPTTLQTMADLKAKEIPFEYRKMDSSKEIAGTAEARLYSSGYKQRAYEMPIVEVNGYVRPRLTTDDIVNRFMTRQ